MQHQVIVISHIAGEGPDGRQTVRHCKIGFINCDSKEQADHIADVLRHRCQLSAEPVVKLWQPLGGSVTLAYSAIEQIAEMYLESGAVKAA